MFVPYRIVDSSFKTTLKIKLLQNLKPNISYVQNVNRNISNSCCKFLAKQKETININTNVVKDVILYKYENPRFFKILNIFAVCQFGFWSYLSIFAFTSLKDAPVSHSDDAAWWQKINLGENKYRNTIALSAFVIGYGILSISWIFTLRSVRYLILRKGGESVTFVTYAPLGINRMMTVGLKNVSCQETRWNARSQLPIKIQNRFLYYILDMKGEFRNPTLFDHTAGLKRILK